MCDCLGWGVRKTDSKQMASGEEDRDSTHQDERGMCVKYTATVWPTNFRKGWRHAWKNQ